MSYVSREINTRDMLLHRLYIGCNCHNAKGNYNGGCEVPKIPYRKILVISSTPNSWYEYTNKCIEYYVEIIALAVVPEVGVENYFRRPTCAITVASMLFLLQAISLCQTPSKRRTDGQTSGIEFGAL